MLIFLTAVRVSPTPTNLGTPRVIALESSDIKTKPHGSGSVIRSGNNKYHVCENARQINVARGQTSSPYAQDANLGVTPAGSTQAAASAVSTYLTVVSGGAASINSVKLPAASTFYSASQIPGCRVIINSSAVPVSVFPSANEYINKAASAGPGSSNFAVSIASGERKHFVAMGSDNWKVATENNIIVSDNTDELLEINLLTNTNTSALNGSGGVAGVAQKADNTYQSFSGGALRKTDRGLIVEAADQNFVAASADFNNAAWAVSNSFAGKVAGTSVLPGQTSHEFESDTTAGLLNQSNRGTFSAGVETIALMVEAMPSATILHFYVADQSNGSTPVLQMTFNFTTKSVTATLGNGTSKRFGFIDFGVGSGARGGNLFLLVMSGVALTSGNTRRIFIYPNGSAAGAAGRKVTLQWMLLRVGSWAASPIVNPSTTSLTRGAEVVTITVPTGTYDVRFTLQDGTLADRYAVSSVANLLTIPTTIAQRAAIGLPSATQQVDQREGYIASIGIWNQSPKNIHVIGDSFVQSGAGTPEWLPSKFYRPRVCTFDGVGGSTLTEQATRADSTPQYFGDVWIIIDGGLESTIAEALAAINRMVAHLTGTKRWLYIEPGLDGSNAGTTGIGTAYYNNQVAVKAAIRAAYPDNYVEVLPTMQSHGDGSANDISDVANGWWPRSLRTDQLHPNGLGSMYYAQIIADAIRTRRW